MIKSLISVLTHTQNAPVEFCRRYQRTILTFWDFFIACEQALRGALATGREKEGQHSTTFLEFEYLHRKSLCEMLIGGDDIGNDVIILGTCLHSRSFPFHTDWRKSDSLVDGEPYGNWRWNIKFQRRVASSPFLPPRHQSAPDSLLASLARFITVVAF